VAATSDIRALDRAAGPPLDRATAETGKVGPTAGIAYKPEGPSSAECPNDEVFIPITRSRRARKPHFGGHGQRRFTPTDSQTNAPVEMRSRESADTTESPTELSDSKKPSHRELFNA
jgi:hypothetical protein